MQDDVQPLWQDWIQVCGLLATRGEQTQAPIELQNKIGRAKKVMSVQ